MAFFGIQIDGAVIERLRAGAPVVELGNLSVTDGLEPGRPVRFIDEHAAPVAVGIADPENGVVRVLGGPELRDFDGRFFARRLSDAWKLRVGARVPESTEAFRLVNSDGEGLSGFTADVYGAFGVVSAPGRGLLPYGRLLAEAMLSGADVDGAARLRGVVLKVRGKDAQDRSAKEEIFGERPPEKLVVEELGARYEVHLLGALNVGLFSDMREQRRGIGRFVAGRRVLNTFAYTGALSVAAARAGASEVTSVDLSSGVLAWAKENFRLSGFAPGDARWRFEVSDVKRFLERALERGTTWDTIILDPPTVSAARASQWSMKKDYPDLIALAAKLLPGSGGTLWVAANARKGPGVLTHLAEGIRRAHRSGAILELGGLPPDYPTPPAWPESRYLEVCQAWVV